MAGRTSDSAFDALNAAPHLINNPSLAASAMVATDPYATAQVMAHTQTLQAVEDHANEHKSMFGFVPKWLSGSVGKTLETLNKPLEEVQHEYRVLHDLISDGEWGKALGMIGSGAVGGVGGFFAAGPMGAVLGAEGAMDIYGRTVTHESWKDMEAGNHEGSISPGRDFAALLDYVIPGGDPADVHKNSKKAGVVDAVFDLSFDPLMALGKVHQARKLERFSATGKNATKNLYATDAAGRAVDELGYAGDLGYAPLKLARPKISDIDTPADRILDVYHAEPRFQSMVDILSKSSTEDILSNLPKLRPLARELGEAESHDDVLNVFRDALTVKNYGRLTGGLPTTGLTANRVTGATIGTQVKNKILDAGWGKRELESGEMIDQPGKLAKGIRTFSSYRAWNISSDLAHMSRSEFNPAEDGAAETLGQILRYSQNRRTANGIVARWMHADTLAERTDIYVHAVTDMFRSFGISDDAEVLTKWKSDLQRMSDASGGMYGLNWDGEKIVIPNANGELIHTGLTHNQVGKFAMPDFNEMRKAFRGEVDGYRIRDDIRGLKQKGLRETPDVIRRLNGKLDDWQYNYYTSKFFKPFALLSLGFAFRVAGGELLPATVKYGKDVVKGALAAAAIKRNPDLAALAANLDQDTAQKLVGIRVGHEKLVGRDGSPRTARIDWIDKDRGLAGVKTDGGAEHTLKLNELDAYHHPIKEKDLHLIAQGVGIHVSKAERNHVRAALHKALYGVSNALVDEDYMRQAYLNLVSHDGHIVAPALAADHGEHRVFMGADTVNESVRALGKKLPDGKRLGSRFDAFDGSSEYHAMYWSNAIHEAANDFSKGAAAYHAAKKAGASSDEALKAFIKADMEHVAANPKLYSQALRAYEQAGPKGFSKARGQMLQGLSYGPARGGERVYHDFVAEAIANGDAPQLQRLEAVDLMHRPKVKGRVLEDIKSEGTLSKISNTGFRKFLYPIINGLAREPIFTTVVTHEYKALKPWVEKGYMSEVEANWIAQQRAVPQMLPLIHNTQLRSQAAEYMRNFLPFYYAQEQAYRRYAKAFTASPLAFARYHLMLHGLQGSGVIQHDEGGENYIVYPHLGAGTDKLAGALSGMGLPFLGGVPNQVSGNVSSLKSVVPGGLVGAVELPGVTPLFAIASKHIKDWFPPSEPFLNELVGPIGSSQSTMDAMIPNSTLRNLIKATPMAENSRSFQSAFLFAIQNAKHRSDELHAKAEAAGLDTPQGRKLLAQANELMPGPEADPQQRQKAVNRIRNTTRLMFVMRAAYSGSLPMSPKIDVGDFELRQEVMDYTKKYGMAEGLQRFLAKNPDATADTVFQADNKFTGVSVAHGPEAGEWIRQNRSFVESNSLAAAYLVPQDRSGYDPHAYNLELATGLAARKTPQEFLESLYVAAGNAKYYPLAQARDEAIAQAPDREEEIRSQFALMKNQMAFSNPVWFADMQDPDRGVKAHYALNELRAAIDGGNAPESPQIGFAKELIGWYDAYVQAEEIAREGGESITGVRERWFSFLDDYATTNPAASAMVNNIFRRLPTYERFGGTQA